MNVKITYLSLLLLVTITSSCNFNKKPSNFDYGTVKNNIYTNNFFNFKMKAPDNWTFATRKEIAEITQQGEEFITENNEELGNLIEASKVRSANLLGLFKYKVDSLVSYNPNIMMVTENLAKIPTIKTGKDYLKETAKLLKKTGLDYTIENIIKKEQISSHDFYVMNTTLNYEGQTVTQTYYSTIVNKFALSAVLSYTNYNEKQKLIDTMKSIQFNN